MQMIFYFLCKAVLKISYYSDELIEKIILCYMSYILPNLQVYKL
jgi:hypothetical protein